MNNVIYSFDPRAGRSSPDEVRREVRSRHLSPDRLRAAWQHEDGNEERDAQVADIVARMRPLRMRA